MKAPDKIYLQRNTTTDLYDDFWPEWFEDTNDLDSDICYIRKDLADEMVKSAEDHAYFAGQENLREKLLEWLKKELERLWEIIPDADNENPAQMELRYLGEYMATERLIDEINEM